MHKYTPVFILLFVALLIPEFAYANFSIKSWNLGLAGYTQYVGKIQTNEAGDKNSFDFNPMLLAGTTLEVPYLPFLITEIGSTLPHDGRDPNISKFNYFISALSGVTWKDIQFLTGAGLAFNYISSSGGQEPLQNGNQMENWPLPDGSTITRNVVIPLGLRYALIDKFTLEAMAHVFNPTNTRNRAVSYFVGLQFNFDWEGKP